MYKKQGFKMRYFLPVIGMLALSACQSAAPDRAGSGYNEYLRGGSQQGGGMMGAPVTSGPIGAAPIGGGAARISDEQDFDAVANRESIESDRERLERQRAQYVAIPPTDLPQRSGTEGANVVQYALNTRNRLGEQVYRRFNPLRFSTAERNCGRFATQDQAQQEFLRRGGPERDPGNLDPDGDGFACWWDPTPYRNALR